MLPPIHLQQDYINIFIKAKYIQEPQRKQNKNPQDNQHKNPLELPPTASVLAIEISKQRWKNEI